MMQGQWRIQRHVLGDTCIVKNNICVHVHVHVHIHEYSDMYTYVQCIRVHVHVEASVPVRGAVLHRQLKNILDQYLMCGAVYMQMSSQ